MRTQKNIQQTVGNESMNARKQKKKQTCLRRNIKFRISKNWP